VAPCHMVPALAHAKHNPIADYLFQSQSRHCEKSRFSIAIQPVKRPLVL
jgi:hypothetical protein